MYKIKTNNNTVVKVNNEEIIITGKTRFFIQMNRKNYMPIINDYFGKINNSNTMEWTECYIDETTYPIDFSNENDIYKIELTSIDESFGSQIFYYSDFIQLIKDGCVIVKTNPFQKPINTKLIENIPNSCATIITETTVVVDTRYVSAKDYVIC